jgi:hypothetical protein
VRKITDRRSNHRYDIHLPVHYRVTQRGFLPLSGSGTTREMSSSGLSFRCRRPLPVGGHVELSIDWPARAEAEKPMELIITGIVIRSDGGRTAVRLTSKRFRTNPAEEFRATA